MVEIKSNCKKYGKSLAVFKSVPWNDLVPAFLAMAINSERERIYMHTIFCLEKKKVWAEPSSSLEKERKRERARARENERETCAQIACCEEFCTKI